MPAFLNRPDVTTALGLFILLCTVNGIAAAAFYIDKQRAIRGAWRIPEAKLLFWAFLGGWFGAVWAQRRFRHKTRKQPFRTLLMCVPLLWLTLAGVIWVIS